MRGVEERIDYYQRHGAPRRNLCAAAVRSALGAPYLGLPDATAVGHAVPTWAMSRQDAPRGSIVYWEGGARGQGHTCLALGDHLELSVDVAPRLPGVARVVPFSWFGEHWPSLRFVGWSWYWGPLDTRPQVLTVP